MADRTDITYIQQLTPRVAEIAAPSTEIVMQDYVDTSRLEEERFQSMGFGKLINASGKEQLDANTIVSITVQEQNLQLAFARRNDPAETGTVTTGSGPPNAVGWITFVDTSADFIAAGVAPGSYIINWTDRNTSDVVNVVDANTLTLKTPFNGTDNEYDIGDDYSVWNVTQVRTSGGNLTAVDEAGDPIPAILPTWGTQVILQTSSSGTISELSEIRYAAYGGGVSLDPTNPNAISGTDYPAGTMAVPSDNWADALTIHNTLGLKKLFLNGTSYTVPASTDLSTDVWIVGGGATVTVLTIPDSANTANLRVQDCYLESSFIDDANLIERSLMNDCTMSGGFYFEVAFTGSQVITGSGQCNIYECYSGVAGGGAGQTPSFDVGGAIIAGRGWTGGVEFLNKGTAAAFSWDMDSGRVIVNDNNTAGTMTFRGFGFWENEDTYAGTTVVDDQLHNTAAVADSVWDALIADHSVSGSFGEFVVRRLLTVAKFFSLRT